MGKRASNVVGASIFVQHREIPVACVQLRAHDRENFEQMWPSIVARVDDAGSRGARLIVLPEGTVPGYVLGDEPVSPALLERAANDLARVARRHAAIVVYGGAKIVNDATFNAAIAIGPSGDELGFAAKQFLWHFDRRWFAPGETLAPIDTPLGKLGLLVCADGRIPTIAATLRDRGAELLVMPTAWVTSGRSATSRENVQADYMASVRARENGVPFIVANKVGVERSSVAYCGKSAAFASDGTTLARASETAEETIVATVVLGARPMPERRTSLPAPPPRADAARSGRVRIAFTPQTTADRLARLERLASEADADLLFARGDATARAGRVARFADGDDTRDLGALCVATATGATLRSPRALVAARRAGIACFVWFADEDAAWHEPFARTRAAELRAYVIVFVDDARAFVVDPDGVGVAGTFGDFTMASFVYDTTRTSTTLVAPTTDVLEGLRVAEAIADEAR